MGRKNYTKKNGIYRIKGKDYKKNRGSRREVWNRTAYQTTGNVFRSGLFKNKHNRIVSKKLRKQAIKDKRLVKSGFLTKKGEFGAFKNGQRVTKKKKKTRRNKRGGSCSAGVSPF
jgi:hypothetical protein